MMSKKLKRPNSDQYLTIARALLVNKTDALGGIPSAVEVLRKEFGIQVATSTFKNWCHGFRTPNGEIHYSPCGRHLNPSTRGIVNKWLGIVDDSWWWTSLKIKHLKKPDVVDPFDVMGLTRPEEV